MFLLDTNVVSELRKVQTGRADANVATWAKGLLADALYISVITVLELEYGVIAIERRDPVSGASLRQWFQSRVVPAFAGRIIAVDVDVARRCAALHVPDRLPERDALIAATVRL